MDRLTAAQHGHTFPTVIAVVVFGALEAGWPGQPHQLTMPTALPSAGGGPAHLAAAVSAHAWSRAWARISGGWAPDTA